MDPNFKMVSSRGKTTTMGLQALGQQEIILRYDNDALARLAQELAKVLMRYVLGGARIVSGQKMSWATSVIRFVADSDRLRAEALDLINDNFTPQIDNILTSWRTQRDTCRTASSRYVATNLSDMAVATPAVLDGAPVWEGVRYPFHNPNSGWWLFDEGYAGDVSTVKRVHIGHILQSHRAIRRYLALQPGFCFASHKAPQVWFEQPVADQEPI